MNLIYFVLNPQSIDEIVILLECESAVAVFACCFGQKHCIDDLLLNETVRYACEQERLFLVNSKSHLWTVLMDNPALLYYFKFELLNSDTVDFDISAFIEDAKKNTIARIEDIEKTAKPMLSNSINLISTALESTGIKSFSEGFKDVPAFIVAAGPSLSKNIQELKNIGDKGLILAVDTAVPLLQKYGITPHCIFSGDFRNKSRYLKAYDTQVPLIFHLETSAETVAAYRGLKIFWGSSSPLSQWISLMSEDKGSYEIGMSVASMALNAALLFGADPIVFVGQDFAYTNGELYAKGIEQGHEGKADDSDLYKVHSRYDGSQMYTKKEFYLYLRYTENRIAKFERNFINSTEGGAGIEHTIHMTLKEAISEYCKNDLGIIETIKSTMKQTIGYDEKHVKQEIQKTLEQATLLKESLKVVEDNLRLAFFEADKEDVNYELINERVCRVLPVLKSVWKQEQLLSFLHAFITKSLSKLKYANYFEVNQKLSQVRQDFQKEYEFVLTVLDGLNVFEKELNKCLGDWK